MHKSKTAKEGVGACAPVPLDQSMTMKFEEEKSVKADTFENLEGDENCKNCILQNKWMDHNTK